MEDNNELSTSETGESQVLRDEKGRFIPGVSGNPGGGPKGQRTALMEIEAAIEDYRHRTGVSYWHAATHLAMDLAQTKGNTTLLCKIIDKFLPNLDKVEADVSAQRPYTIMPSIMIRTEDGKLVEKRYNIGTEVPGVSPGT